LCIHEVKETVTVREDRWTESEREEEEEEKKKRRRREGGGGGGHVSIA